ncbi:hypothetical protein [Nocardia sp. NPDC059691]|uniref:hypothetical protein n=1 Tax=Nocardia sp. NPDC059691 TaxID=3346908 RepID=UPI00367FE0FC
MATQVFAAEELARLREFPEISREELFRFFTLTSADPAFVAPGRADIADFMIEQLTDTTYLRQAPGISN